jgi:hypothetical protein
LPAFSRTALALPHWSIAKIAGKGIESDAWWIAEGDADFKIFMLIIQKISKMVFSKGIFEVIAKIFFELRFEISLNNNTLFADTRITGLR